MEMLHCKGVAALGHRRLQVWAFVVGFGVCAPLIGCSRRVKTAAETQTPYDQNLSCAQERWAPNHAFDRGAVIAGGVSGGRNDAYIFEANTAGASGASEPAWDPEIGK